ncbi:MAG: acyl-CoA dehydrogenase family protein [Pseudomonadota bacterium]
MDFSITEEQSMLADTLSRFIDNEYTFENRMQVAESAEPFSADIWQTYAELGLTAALLDEADGGLGGGPVELMLIMEQFGRGLVLEPYLANVVLAGGLLKRVGNAQQKEELLAKIVDGSLQAALAFAEPQARYDVANISTIATKSSDGFVLSGRKTLVLNGASADVVVVPARTSGEQADTAGISLFLVSTKSAGVSIDSYQTVDAHGSAEIELSDVEVAESALLGEADRGYEVLQQVIDEATLAVSAEAVGILRTLHDKTVEYVKDREQFGVPIGSFQALQHRLVDTLMLCEQSRSLLLWAVMLAAENKPEAARAISALKYQVGTAGRQVAQEAVQMHGGMGVTWEMDIAHYFKRHQAIGALFGDADFHLDRYLSLS